MNIVSLIGSYRKDSFNQKLVSYIEKRYQEKVSMTKAPIDQLPMYNQDLELDPPEIVNQVKQMIQASDGILIATPEYNHSIPAVLKNVLDWGSRVEPIFVKKPVMIVGASLGSLGTVRAQEHLRQILKSTGVNAYTLPGNEVFIGEVHNKMDEQGKLTHQPTIEYLDDVLEAFFDWIVKTKSL